MHNVAHSGQASLFDGLPVRNNGSANKINSSDQPVHGWYRFVLSFPPHLVRQYVERFGLSKDSVILDPFCGTGTTIVEAKKLGINGIGVEANPVAHLASSVKTDWGVDPDALRVCCAAIGKSAMAELSTQGISDSPGSSKNAFDTVGLRTLPPETAGLLLTDSISPLPLHKCLVLLDHINRFSDQQFFRHALLAFAKTAVLHASNLEFGPEVGVARTKKADACVVPNWLSEIHSFARDIKNLQQFKNTPSRVYLADARQLNELLPPSSIDAVFTSPPYPNEKDYTRTTRLESVLLGHITTKSELRSLKKGLIRSNTRTVYKGDDDDLWISHNREIEELAGRIESRRIALGKTSGFERQYSRVTKLYFGGMARHLSDLRRALKPGAMLGYVVGDQASYFRITIQTGRLLADIAQSLGYELISIDLFRTRLATATKTQMREEVVVLRWPG